MLLYRWHSSVNAFWWWADFFWVREEAVNHKKEKIKGGDLPVSVVDSNVEGRG